jgi:hypothetical protein
VNTIRLYFFVLEADDEWGKAVNAPTFSYDIGKGDILFGQINDGHEKDGYPVSRRSDITPAEAIKCARQDDAGHSL